jgi:translation initiation factor IF-3
MREGGRASQQKEPKVKINHMIRAPEVRVIDDEGTMLGVMTPAKALEIAEARGLDLVEVAPTAKPPTCKVMDYGKYLYEQKKKTQESKKKQVVIVVKELQLRPRTDIHDVQVKLNQAKKFILHGDKVKLSMRFRGREMAHQEIGMELIKKFIKEMEEVAMVEAPPKIEGQQAFVMIVPDPVKVKAYKKAHAHDDDKKEKPE